MDEVAQHNTEQSAWFVHEGSVYDATPYLEEHPGGETTPSRGRNSTPPLAHYHTRKHGSSLPCLSDLP